MPTGKITPISNLVGKIDKGAGTNDHNKLINRDLVDQHPIEAIIGLLDALNQIDSKILSLDEKIDSGADFVASELQIIRQDIGKWNQDLEILTDQVNELKDSLGQEIESEISRLQNQLLTLSSHITSLETTLLEKINTTSEILTQSIHEVREELRQDILELESNFLLFRQAIEVRITNLEGRVDTLQNTVDSTSIESLSTRKIYQVFNYENPSENDGFYKAVIFDEGTVYFEYVDEVYKKVDLTEQTFEADKYYYYFETDANNISPTAKRVVKNPGFYPVYTYSHDIEFYRADYDADTSSIVGIWRLPEKLPYIGDYPNNTVWWINEAQGYFYTDRTNKVTGIVEKVPVTFSRFGCLLNAYGARPDNRIWGIAIGSGWNGSYGIQEIARYLYPDSMLGREGYDNFAGDGKPDDAMRTLYFTSNVPNSTLAAFKTLDPIKLSDTLLPYNNEDYSYSIKYVEETITESDFKPGKFYTKFEQVTDPTVPKTTEYLIKAKNYNSATDYYVIDYYDEISEMPIYKKVTVSREEFYADPTIDYYKILTLRDTLRVLDVARLDLQEDRNIIRTPAGNEALLITNDEILVNGKRLTPKLTVTSKDTLNKILEDNAEITISEPLTNLYLTIPSDIKHGFCSYLTFESSSKVDPVINITNLSKFNFRIIRDNEVKNPTELDLQSGCQYNLLFICNGINVELYIQEILVD